jgi:hypothetical protein
VNFRILVPFVMLFLVVAGFLLYRDQLKDLDTTDTAPGPSEMVREEPTTAEETTGSSEEENGVRVVVSVVGTGGVGLSILEDGRLVYDRVASPGFSEEFRAEEAITVRAAEGDAVRVAVDGEEPEPLGTSGEWTTRTFTAAPQS